jgi:hypothetical protein
MSLNERKKESQNSGKGHNELLEIASPLEQTRVATDVVQRRMSENRGTGRSTCQHVILASVGEFAEKGITASNPTQKPTSSQFFITWFLSLTPCGK